MSNAIAEMRDSFSVVSKGIRLISSSQRRLQSLVGCITRNQSVAAGKAGAARPYLGFGESEIGQGRGHVLMTYVVAPFHDGGASAFRQNYSNHVMSLEMAKAFVHLGYVVDIVDWQDTEFIPEKNYDVFLGMTANFDRLFRCLPQSAIKIYWATRPTRSFEEQAIAARLDALEKRRGVRLDVPRHLIPLLESEALDEADAVIALGNSTI